jgi:cathepsin L
VLSCLFAAALALGTHELLDRSLDEHWAHFKRVHSKKYNLLGQEFNRRLTWQKNVQTINQHNIEADLGLHTYRLGLNQYADLTPKEFAAKFTGLKKPASVNTIGRFERSQKALPDSVDWRKEGYVTPIKDQAQCGSCWSFSSTGSIEGQNFKKTGKLIPLSEQQLVDCSGSEGNQGCGGGWMDQAIEYIIKAGGIESEADYGYTAQDGTCHFDINKVAVKLSGYHDVDKNENALQEAVATVGPISIALDATGFFLYKSGIFDDSNCQPNSPDHAVLAVGYGSEAGTDFWIVKNSWGASWGEAGYIRMHRNANNLCGLANYATYPIVA